MHPPEADELLHRAHHRRLTVGDIELHYLVARVLALIADAALDAQRLVRPQLTGREREIFIGKAGITQAEA